MAERDKAVENGHSEYYAGERKRLNQGRVAAPGSQYLVHLFRGGYLGPEYVEGGGRKLLDVGCGSGFNAVTMDMLGWDVTGCEINEEIAEHARQTMEGYAARIPVKVGENERLPFADGEFDFLLSMNVLHYASSGEAMDCSISEYARVLKPGGRFLALTIRPGNWLLEGATYLDANRMKVHSDTDYRDGHPLYVFQDAQQVMDAFSLRFSELFVGENSWNYITKTICNFLVTGIKQQ